MQPKVSVIVPVFNTGKYLKRCLDSLVNQTLKEIEIIVVNDGSTDNSSDIINSYKNDDRVILLSQENKGLSAARNLGLKHAKGECIGFVDSDDFVDADFFEKLYDSIMTYNSDVSCASIVRKYETFEKWRILYDKALVLTDKEDIRRIINYPNQSYVWNKLYRSDFLKKINYSFEEGVFYEDIKATLNIVLNAKRLSVVPYTNYYYMVNQRTSITKSKKTAKKETDRYNNQKYIIKSLMENKFSLNRDEYYIKKHEYTLFNIPLLKVKEDLYNDKKLYLLFNFLPILYI